MNKRTLSARIFLAASLAAAPPAWALSATTIANTLVTDGVIYSVLATPATTYIGGSFKYVNSFAGSGVILDKNTGALLDSSASTLVNGGVYTSVADGSGGWYIGGAFTQVGGVTKNNLAHILSDGTLDSAWGAGGDPNAAVFALTLSGSTLYVGGNFTSIGGQARQLIAALSAATGNPTAWNPSATGTVYSIVVGNSAIYVGGLFGGAGGGFSPALAAIDPVTGLAIAAFNPNLQGNVTVGVTTVYAMLLSGTTLYVGGNFTNAGSSTRNCFVAFDTTTNHATSWDPEADDWGASFAVSGSTLYAGGYFRNIGGQPQVELAAFNKTTGALSSWNPNIINDGSTVFVRSILVSGTTVYAGGDFDNVGGQEHDNLVALDATTGNPNAWNAGVNNGVWTMALNGGTSIYTGGVFEAVNGQRRNNIAAFNAVTKTLTSWDPNADGIVQALAVSGDGSTVYAGGSFENIGGQARSALAALDSTSGNATVWNPNPQFNVLNTSPTIAALAVSGSTVYAGGVFTSIGVGGSSRAGAAALDASGNATAWNPGLNGTPSPPNNYPIIRALAIGGSTVYVGGFFSTAGFGQTRNSLAAFDTTGNLLPWDPKAATTDYGATGVAVEALISTGSLVYAGGNFSMIGGQARGYVAALDATTGNATAWNPNLVYIPPPPAINDGAVFSLSLNGSTLFAGGEFNRVGGLSLTNLAALDTVSGYPLDWDPNPSSLVFGLSVNNSVLSVAGEFLSIAGVSRGNYDEFLTSQISGVFQPAQLAMGTATGAAGSDVALDLTFTPSPDLGITIFQYDLALPAGVTYDSTTVGPAATAAGKMVTDNPAVPRVIISGLNNNLIGSGVVATVHLHIAATTPAGTLAIPIVNTQAASPDPFSVPMNSSNGSLTVTAGPSSAFAPRVYPNPWRSDRAGALPITFDQLTGNTTIKIFTASGRHITTLTTTSSASWPLTNDSGDKVASGLYFYLITDNLGHKTTGELVIIK